MDGQMQQPDPFEQISQAAQTLAPEEQQILAQSLTPEFIQIMVKLFGEQAAKLLEPLVGPQSQLPPPTPDPNALSNFNAQAAANGNTPVALGMRPGSEGLQAGMEEDEGVCPHCGGQDPNCPACSLQYPTEINFGRG